MPFLKLNDGVFIHSLLHQGAPEVVMKSRVGWVHLDRLTKEFDCLVILARLKGHPCDPPTAHGDSG